jgi:phage terminase small subunit
MSARRPRQSKILAGTFRRDREPEVPAAPEEGAAQPPSWLPAIECAAFRRLERETAATGTPTRSFGAVLEGAALVLASLQRYTATLTEAGETYESATTSGALKICTRPEVHLRDTALRLLKGYLAELGLTPGSVGRIDLSGMPRPRDAAHDAYFERFFGNRREIVRYGARGKR